MRKLSYKKHASWLFFILFALVWLVIALLYFISSLERIETQATDAELAEVADCNAAQTRFVFEQYVKTMSAVVNSFEGLDDFTSPESLALLDTIAKEDVFIRLAIDFASGSTYTSDGHVFNIKHLNYADRIKAGTPFFLDVINALTDETPTVSVLVPIKGKDGTYEAALRGAIPTQVLTDVFSQTFATAGGYYHVVDGNGKYVSSGNNANSLLMDENYFDAIEKLAYEHGFSAAQIKNAFVEKQKGYSKYAFEDEARYAYYTPVGINNWIMLMVIPKEVVEHTANLHILNAFFFVSQITIVFLFFVFYVYFSQKRAKNTAELNEKCFRVLAEQTNKAIFEWNCESNHISYLSDFQNLLGMKGVSYLSAEEALCDKAVHQDDREALHTFYDAIASAKNISNLKFRGLNSDGCYCWYQVSVTFVTNQNGAPYKAVGLIENIDEQVKKEEHLRRKSETDQLTGVYNKATTEYLIEAALMESNAAKNKHAFMVIDIDNYKNVNDRLGHLYGDMVLAQLAASLKSVFRSADILGRLGGDEFFVLLKNIETTKTITEKAITICQKFRKTYSEGDVSASISASVGVSVFPDHGVSFEQLYKAADTALYNVKASGKNNYKIYDGLKMQNYISDRTDIDAFDGIQKNFHGHKLEYIFQLLYGAEDQRAAVQSVLRLVADLYGLCRVNIFEADEKGPFAFCSFEWCADGVCSAARLQARIPMEQLADVVREFGNREGIFVKKTADFPEHLQEAFRQLSIQTMICCIILNEDQAVGAIIFQDCVNKELLLTENDLTELQVICQVLSTFILKQRGVEQEKQYRHVIESIVNNMEGLAYVVEKDSWKLIFENEQIRKLTGASNVGKICYESFQHRTAPCENCPIAELTKETRKASVEINNELSHIISRTTGSEINWIDNKLVYLISSIDISGYKKEIL